MRGRNECDVDHIAGTGIASVPVPAKAIVWGTNVMDFSCDLQPVYHHHDLLIEVGRVEMAMEHLEERGENERQALRPRLLSRLSRLRDELQHLAV
jgi:hypothetical protein